MDNVQMIIALITAMGGIEGIKGAISWYRTRRAERRTAEANATGVEVSNLGIVVQNMSAQITQMNERLDSRDEKIDEIYEKYRAEQEDHLKTMHELFQAQFFRCEVEDCGQRQPPRVKLVSLLQKKAPEQMSN